MKKRGRREGRRRQVWSISSIQMEKKEKSDSINEKRGGSKHGNHVGYKMQRD